MRSRTRIAQRLAAIEALAPDHPDASLAAFTVPGVADAVSQAIDADLQAAGVTDVTAQYRPGPRVIKQGKADYLLPTVVHAASPEAAVTKKEYMFPFVTVVECPEAKMLEAIGPTLVCTAITNKPELRRSLLDAVHIDRLNFGAVPTIQLNWLQPHEGNIVDFLFRARAFQSSLNSMPAGSVPPPCAGRVWMTLTGHAFQWPQWRGPTRDGIVPAANVPARGLTNRR